MGDPVENCLSVIITRDGGKTWNKLSCDQLPGAAEGEAAFAASNSNIAVEGEKAWILSGGAAFKSFLYSGQRQNMGSFRHSARTGRKHPGRLFHGFLQ